MAEHAKFRSFSPSYETSPHRFRTRNGRHCRTKIWPPDVQVRGEGRYLGETFSLRKERGAWTPRVERDPDLGIKPILGTLGGIRRLKRALRLATNATCDQAAPGTDIGTPLETRPLPVRRTERLDTLKRSRAVWRLEVNDLTHPRGAARCCTRHQKISVDQIPIK